MTPVLYKSTEVDFKDNGLGPLTEIYDVDVAEQQNGLFQLTATYPTNGKLYNNMDVGNIILAKPNPTATAHAFRIVVSDLDVFSKNLQIEADSITYDLTHNLIKHVVLDGDGQTAMSQLQRATMNPHLYTFTSDILHSSKSELNMVNPMEAIAGTQGSFLQIWGGELKRENRKISMLNRRGRDNVTSFRLGKNISGLKYSVDMSSVVTQIIPYVTKSDSESENTQYIYGMIINSKNINNYPSIYLQQVDVSDKITVEETDTDAIITGKINEYAKDWFTKSENTDRDEPKVTVDIDVLSLQDSSDYQDKFKDLEMVELTDTVTVYVPEFNINVTAIVNELHYDPVSERIISLVVGAAKVSFSDANNNTLNDIQNKIDEIHKDANNAAESANGKNTVYWGKDKPLHPVKGDLWYWTDGENEGLKIFKNGEWEDVLDTNVKQAIDDAQKEAEEATNKANDAVSKANDAVANAGFAKDTADNAKSDAADALSKAGEAFTNAGKAIDDINNLDQTVKTEISNINGQLSQKVSQITFDDLKKTVTSQGTEIDQNKNDIALKANQTTVDQINGTVKQLDAELKIQGDQITSKVSRNDVTGMLSGYATQSWTQSQIKQTADSFDISVSNVQNNLDNLTTGARNLILNSGNLENSNHWTSDGSLTTQTHPFWKNNTEKMFVLHATTSAETTLSSTRFPLEKGKEYIVQFDGFQNSAVSSVDVWILSRKYGSSASFDTTMRIKSEFTLKASGVTHTNIKFTVPDGMDEAYLRFDNNGTKTAGQTAELWITDIKVAREDNPSPWAPAPEDYATVDKLSELQVTVNGIQGTVQNKADKSQVTQLADQITSVVGSIGSDNLVVDGSFEHVAIGSKPLWWTLYMPNNMVVIANPPASNATVRADAHVLKLTGAATGNVEPSGPFFSVTPGDEFYCEFKTRWSTTGLKGDVVLGLIFYDVDRKTITGAVGGQSKTVENWAKHSGVVKAPSNAAYAKAWVAWRNSNNAVDYVTVTDLIIRRNSATQSQITQLANDINLRVKAGDVVNQINISPESILIAGNKVHITGQTTIDSAVIKSAMIANISADKITAGTINAANVNLINMNASNITTGTIKGASLSINLLNGNVTFQKGRIYSTLGTIDMNIDEGYLSVTNATGTNKNNVLIRNGEIAFTQPGLFDPSKDPYLRITNDIVESTLGSSTIQARNALEMNVKGHESSMTHLDEEKFAGIKFGQYGSGQLGTTYIGGANVGVVISGGTSTTYMMNMSPRIVVGSTAVSNTGGNRVSIDAEYLHAQPVFKQTTSSGANVYVAPDGALVRSTSASKYKQNIVRYVDLNDSEKLLNVPLAMWDDKAELKRTGTSKRYFGMIAEDLASVGLEYLVSRGPNGEIEGIEYSKVALLLIPEVKKLRNKIEMLEQQNGGNIA